MRTQEIISENQSQHYIYYHLSKKERWRRSELSRKTTKVILTIRNEHLQRVNVYITYLEKVGGEERMLSSAYSLIGTKKSAACGLGDPLAETNPNSKRSLEDIASSTNGASPLQTSSRSFSAFHIRGSFR